ncbi:MAG: hypothetical protein AAF675_17580 [Pseudomonadota bacterium]
MTLLNTVSAGLACAALAVTLLPASGHAAEAGCAQGLTPLAQAACLGSAPERVLLTEPVGLDSISVPQPQTPLDVVAPALPPAAPAGALPTKAPVPNMREEGRLLAMPAPTAFSADSVVDLRATGAAALPAGRAIYAPVIPGSLPELGETSRHP